MADIQKQFGEFHKKIKLTEENEELRDKRDIILDLLRERLAEIFTAKGEIPPVFEEFNQGSYAMHTGTVPVNGDYDIDVGLRFNVSKDDFPNPVVVKQWILEALQGHTTETVEIKEPCMRVIYSVGDEPSFHVDLAIYSSGEVNLDGKTYLARGKPSSDADKKVWEESGAQDLIELVNNHFPGDDYIEERKQFRRVIRYMKRWKDLNFLTTGHSAPVGIGLTLAALKFYTPFINTDPFTNIKKADDLSALIHWIDTLINDFQVMVDQYGNTFRFLYMPLPVVPYTDVFSKMTYTQTTEFHKKLQNLKTELEAAQSEPDIHEACKRLSDDNFFGEDFPVPEKEETGEPRAKAYTSSGQSG